jgi:hypothetical protein
MSSENSNQVSSAKEAATILLGCYSKIPASEAQIFVAKLVELLAYYPGAETWITHPIRGIPGKYPYFPSLADIRKELDARRAEEAEEFERSRKYESWGQKELEPPKPTEAEMAHVEARRREFSDGVTGRNSGGHFSPGVAMAKLGITEAQWATIPDLPKHIADLETDPTGRPVRGGFRKLGNAAAPQMADYSHVKPAEAAE